MNKAIHIQKDCWYQEGCKNDKTLLEELSIFITHYSQEEYWNSANERFIIKR